MSYDLQFIVRNGMPPAMDALGQWAQTPQYFTINNKDEDGTLAYENSDTGVYFNLYRSSEGIALNLNYCRPTFFVLETAEVMSKLVAEFSLVVNDDRITEYDPDTLVDDWKRGNSSTCRILKSIGNTISWLEETKATALWHYLRDLKQITEEYDEYFVPKVVVVRLENQLVRGAYLTRPTAYVMPPVDVFFLENDRIVFVERVLEVLKPYLTQLDGFERFDNISYDDCFDTDVMDIWESMYDLLTPDFMRSQIEGKAFPMDGFVNVRPPVTSN